MVLEWAVDATIQVPISAIEHYSYCPRQCALIHVEQTYDENIFTIRGSIAHERVDSGVTSADAGMRIERDVPLWSERLGLRGKADVVEFRPDPYPVEYKSGPPRGSHADLQLCAQAMCLEEMLDVQIPRGAIYHHATRHRREVDLTPSLRRQVTRAVEDIRAVLVEQHLPEPVNDKRCPPCSLVQACMPAVVAERDRIRGLQGALFIAYDAGPDDA